MADRKTKTREPVIQNRRARHDYLVLQTYQAGIALAGSEVKSIRAGKASLAESFGRLEGQEVFLSNMYITPYENSRIGEIEPRRTRKLLLNRREIDEIARALGRRGLTLVPLKLYFKRGRVKVDLGLARGKKAFDKRDDLRRREAEREMMAGGRPSGGG